MPSPFATVTTLSMVQIGGSYYFLPASFLRLAQKAFIRWDWAFRAAAVMRVPPPLVLGANVAAWAAAIAGFFGGRPRRFEPCRTSIARFILSRSATRSATMCSVGMVGRCYHPPGFSSNAIVCSSRRVKTTPRAD